MKKLLTSAIIASSLVFWTISANNNINDEAGLYKAVILSRAKIEKDFWANYNKTINNFFENMRAKPDFKKIDEIEARAEKFLNNYKSGSYDKNYNLVANVYYRIKLLKNYQLKDVVKNYNNSNVTKTQNSEVKKDDVIKWVNQITTTNNNITNIISNNSKIPNQSNSNSSKNLSFSYKLPQNWKEYKKWDEILLVDETYSKFQNSISFIITDYSKNNSFENFKDEYRKELEKNYSVYNYNSNNIDWKTTYALKYNYNSEERIVYLVEYNGKVLVINSIRRNSSISNNDTMKELLDSVKISN